MLHQLEIKLEKTNELLENVARNIEALVEHNKKIKESQSSRKNQHRKKTYGSIDHWIDIRT